MVLAHENKTRERKFFMLRVFGFAPRQGWEAEPWISSTAGRTPYVSKLWLAGRPIVALPGWNRSERVGYKSCRTR